jgi:hypothetical protein
LLKNRQVFGRPKKFSVEIAASWQQTRVERPRRISESC